jgi:mannose-6-phosphate isomerase-like protein (cupin superfamily)
MPNHEVWPADLDALIAAPQNHTLLFENDLVRVLETRIQPGQTVPLHTHQWPCSLYILSWSQFVRRDAGRRVTAEGRTGEEIPAGSVVWSPPLPPHTFENVGTVEFRAISVEIKSGCPTL